MKKIIMLKGLPGSGKTTYSKELVSKGYKRINKDDLRNMLDNGLYNISNEVNIVKVRDLMVEYFVSIDKNIVLDDCNFNPWHEKDIKRIVEFNNEDPLRISFYEFEIKHIDTDLETCVKRDSLREKPVGEDNIRKMYTEFVAFI